jgi:hypothetical protein
VRVNFERTSPQPNRDGCDAAMLRVHGSDGGEEGADTTKIILKGGVPCFGSFKISSSLSCSLSSLPNEATRLARESLLSRRNDSTMCAAAHVPS